MRHDTPLLEVSGLSKRYGPVIAAKDVDIAFRSGELVGLIGDNGAGKSTLVKMLCGAIRPDAGRILHRGEEIRLHDPLEAKARGIEIVYQNLALAGKLDVAANLFVGRETVYRFPMLPRILGLVKRRGMRQEAATRLEDLHVTVPAVSRLTVESLSGGQRQAVAIARAATWATEVLFMDEPTAALGVKQSEAVLNLAKRLVDRGLAVVLITHNLPQMMEYVDRIIVLRHGRKVADMPRPEATPELLVSLMVGFDERVGSLSGVSRDETQDD